MKRSALILSTVMLAPLLALPVSAHHSRSNFNEGTSVTVTGTVTEFAFTNPHIFIEVAADDGATWLVEAHSVTGMKRRGWVSDTFVEGEIITVTGTPDKNTDKKLMALISVEKQDGASLRGGGGEGSAGPAEPSTDYSGTWGMDMRSFDVRAAGGPPPKDWPYTEEGARQAAAYDPEDSPELACKEIGVPRIVIYPYSINFIRTDKALKIHKEHLNEYRTIWFDAADAEAANEPASPTGTSVGEFISDNELRIVTDNFTPTEWGIENALDSSDQKRVEETYMLSEDGLRMEVSMSITDPVLFTDPVVRAVAFNKEANREFDLIPCDPRAADRHVTLAVSEAGSEAAPTLSAPKTWWRFWE